MTEKYGIDAEKFSINRRKKKVIGDRLIILGSIFLPLGIVFNSIRVEDFKLYASVYYVSAAVIIPIGTIFLVKANRNKKKLIKTIHNGIDIYNNPKQNNPNYNDQSNYLNLIISPNKMGLTYNF